MLSPQFIFGTKSLPTQQFPVCTKKELAMKYLYCKAMGGKSVDGDIYKWEIIKRPKMKD